MSKMKYSINSDICEEIRVADYKFLEFCRQDATVASKYPELCAEAGRASVYYREHNKEPIVFESFLELYDESNNKDYILFFGVTQKSDTNGDLTDINYHFCKCLKEECDTSPVVRKYHFDSISANKAVKKPHPLVHIQYAGKPTKLMEEKGFCVEKMKGMYPKIEGPRLPFMPMTLCILVNLIFKEYPTESSIKIMENNYWRAILYDCETSIIKTYYDCIYNFLNDNRSHKAKTNLLTSNFLYNDL